MELIKQETGISMPIRTVEQYLQCWAVTLQKPIKRVYEQEPQAGQCWLDEDYSAIHTEQRRKRLKFTGGMSVL